MSGTRGWTGQWGGGGGKSYSLTESPADSNCCMGIPGGISTVEKA